MLADSSGLHEPSHVEGSGIHELLGHLTNDEIETSVSQPGLHIEAETKVRFSLVEYPRGDDDFPSLRLAYLIGHAAHVADEIGH